jgi:hypothetical protein
MSFKTVALNALSLGGHGKLATAQEVYQAEYQAYGAARSHYEKAHNALTLSLSTLGEITEQAMATLSEAHTVILYSASRQSRTAGSLPIATGAGNAHPKLDHIAELICTYDGVQSAAAGAGAGSAVAIGSWSLVSIVGAASTGTAISSLSGVAATNATLAWFGGGALAAGGAGMAGGTLMLGGLALVPVVAFATWKARAKLKEVTNETVRIAAETVQAFEGEIRLRQDQQVADRKRQQLIAVHQELDAQLDATKQVVFSNVIARSGKFLKRTFGREVFTEQDLSSISDLERAAVRLADLFDTSDHFQPSIGSMRPRGRA